MNFSCLARLGALIALSVTFVFAEGNVSYSLHKSENPSADEQEADKLITAAMDSAMYYYNKYTDLSKYINVYYSTGVPTAEASSNGDLRFGKDRNYMYVGTAMHEIAHTMGMGTTSEYQAMFKNGVFLGEKAQALLKELDGADAELHGDSQHFWPYGLNYRSEVHSELDLINHAKIVNAMYQDIFKEAFYKDVVIKNAESLKCMGITADNALTLMDCSAEGAVASLYFEGDNPVTFRIQLGKRVVDIPNESIAAGVVASTYGWNGGAHQRYIFEAAPMQSPDTYYFQNYKSKLYLQANGSQIVQNSLKEEKSFIWLLGDIESEQPAKDTTTRDTTVADTSGKGDNQDSTKTEAIARSVLDRANVTAPANSRKFDIKGRTINATKRQREIRRILFNR